MHVCVVHVPLIGGWSSHVTLLYILCLSLSLSACNCNRHARQCRFDLEIYSLSGSRSGGVCIKCRHKTAGRNCQYCTEGHYKDPAKSITDHKACKGRHRIFFPSFLHSYNCSCVCLFFVAACQCNLHARRCRFNRELYLLSGRQTGGVCLKCRHHTAGRHCQYCQEGFYRDRSKPIIHRKTCKGRRRSLRYCLAFFVVVVSRILVYSSLCPSRCVSEERRAFRYRPLSLRLDRCYRMIQNESRYPNGGIVFYVTMQISFLTRKFQNVICIVT